MSEEKNSKQISLWGDSHANRSVSQVNKKEEMTTDISGQKCLDSLKKSNPSSLLERMCKELLTSKTAWSSDRCKMTWKVKVSKSNVSLYQLQASVLGTKGSESGLWLTPSTMDISQRSPDAMKKRIEMRKKTGEDINTSRKFIGTSANRETDKRYERSNGYGNDEDVSNTENRRGKQTERQGRESIRRGSDDRIWFEGERKNIKTNVSNTESIGTRGCRDTDQEEGRESCSSTQSDGTHANVSQHESSRGTSSIQETIIPNSDKFRLERDNETKEASSRRWTEATTKSNSSNVSDTIGTGSRREDSRNFNEQGRITIKTQTREHTIQRRESMFK
jgi:hypothetical protein